MVPCTVVVNTNILYPIIVNYFSQLCKHDKESVGTYVWLASVYGFMVKRSQLSVWSVYGFSLCLSCKAL